VKTPRLFLAAALSGVLLWTAFFPLDLGPVSCIALAPFLLLVRAEATRRKRYAAAYLGGFVFFALAVNWVQVAHPMMRLFTWPAGALYCACYWPAALVLLRWIDSLGKVPLTVSLPVVWVALEYFRSHFPTGFPFLSAVGLHQLIGFNWYALGYSMHGFLPVIQAADLGGVYLISAAIASLNGAAYGWLVRSSRLRTLFALPVEPKRRTFIFEAYETAWASIFPILVICYGTVQLAHPPYTVGPRVAAIQGSVPQNEKMVKESVDGITPLEREYLPLSARAALPAETTPRPDLVIWPETCFPYDWDSLAPNFTDAVPEAARVRLGVSRSNEFFRSRLEGLPPVPLLLGLNRLEWSGMESATKFNAAMLFDGNKIPVGAYDKMHLVPFGEYVPFRSKFLQNFTPYKGDYSCEPGTNWTVFTIPAAKSGETFRFGLLICYEDTDPLIARQYNPLSGRGHDVDFLVNISNDGWFTGTEEHEQHLAICRFRAVEARRSIVRAVNTGISAIIDPDGRIQNLPDPSSNWAKSKVTAAVVRGEVLIDTRGTYYAQFGDWVPAVCWLVIVVLTAWAWLNSRRTPSA